MATTTCSGSSRRTPPSNAPISSSRRPSSCASSSTTTRNGSRCVGGLTLIDEEPDYLSIAPDLTFRSRSRYQDDVTGEWVSETEVIETASELVELYNPADIYAAFAEAAREAAGMGVEPTAEDDLLETAGISIEETVDARRGSVRRRRRLVGGRPGRSRSRPTTTRPPPIGCTTSRSSTRSAASAARRACSRSSKVPPPA